MQEDDLRIEVFKRGDGKTAVKIIHVPTGKVAMSDKHYSMHDNRTVALAELISMVYAYGKE